MSIVNSVGRIKKDLQYLNDLLQRFYKSSTQEWSGKDDEFIRIWDLFKEIRNDLILLDEKLFIRLRDLLRPEPESNSLRPDGIYSRKDFTPVINELNLAVEYFDLYVKSISKSEQEISVDTSTNLLTSRFGKIVRQLRSRYDHRTTLEINDEYDMQDLFHSLLFLFFDDIRPEEWTPSYAGGCSRMDFLLKNEKIAIELKKTRKSLDAKELGKQLIVDIEKYKQHPDCEELICFVYDPEFWIANPKGIENDLSQEKEDFKVKVIIEPK